MTRRIFPGLRASTPTVWQLLLGCAATLMSFGAVRLAGSIARRVRSAKLRDRAYAYLAARSAARAAARQARASAKAAAAEAMAAKTAAAEEVRRQREANEAREKLQQLREEERRLMEIAGGSDCKESGRAEGEECVVCMVNPRTHVLIPCGHQCICKDCVVRLRKLKPRACPVCRQPFTSEHQVFKV